MIPMNAAEMIGLLLIESICYKLCEMLYSESSLFFLVKGLLLIFGIFFAWETRKVKIEALNDSQQIGICVYNVMVMSVVAVPLVNILSESQMDIVYGVTAMAILICVTTTLVLVFGSKVINIDQHNVFCVTHTFESTYICNSFQRV